MGRIRNKQIKRSAKELIHSGRERFSDNFEDNKKAVMEAAEIQSKKLRNVLAGYITHLMKKKV